MYWCCLFVCEGNWSSLGSTLSLTVIPELMEVRIPGRRICFVGKSVPWGTPEQGVLLGSRWGDPEGSEGAQAPHVCVGAALALPRHGKAEFCTEQEHEAPTIFILFFFFLTNVLFSLRQMSRGKTILVRKLRLLFL